MMRKNCLQYPLHNYLSTITITCPVPIYIVKYLRIILKQLQAFFTLFKAFVQILKNEFNDFMPL